MERLCDKSSSHSTTHNSNMITEEMYEIDIPIYIEEDWITYEYNSFARGYHAYEHMEFVGGRNVEMHARTVKEGVQKWNIETLPDGKEFKNLEKYSPSSMLSVFRSAACGGHSILHSIFLTCVRIVDTAVNMLYSSKVIFETLSSWISFSYSLFTITDVDKVSRNTSTLLFTVTKLTLSVMPQFVMIALICNICHNL